MKRFHVCLDSMPTVTTSRPFNGPLSGTIRVSRYQKGKTNLDFTEARDSEWQWNPLGHMQVCTSSVRHCCRNVMWGKKSIPKSESSHICI